MLPSLKEIIDHYQLRAQKSLGQNFLLDLNLTTKIARAAGDLKHGTVIEIGPGPGGLTRALLSLGAPSVIAIEPDERCIRALESLVEAYPGQLKILHEDARKLNLTSLAPPPFKVVANLPYYVATVLLFQLLEEAHKIASMTLMFQKEVAERIVAQPGTKAYGRLAVMAQWRCRCETVFDISPKAFVPAPKVTSTVVNFYPYAQPLYPADPQKLETVVKTAFQQRRKMLRASLKGVFSNPEDVLKSLGIEPEKRAENLTIQEFCRLSEIPFSA